LVFNYASFSLVAWKFNTGCDWPVFSYWCYWCCWTLLYS